MMAVKADLQDWVLEALRSLGGKAKLIDVAKRVWKTHKKELERSDNLFFTWQYDMRWAATVLRKAKKLKPAKDSPRGVWEIK